MSVVGEYRRLLDDLLAALADSSSFAAQSFGDVLGQAHLERAPHVSAAAERALAILEGDDEFAMGELDSAIERKRIADRLDHFTAICRVVLGR